MVLKGVDEIDWFTDRPDRFEGLWKPQKLIRQWDSLFENSDPNAQASFKVGEKREIITFESRAELVSKAKFLLENPNVGQKIAIAGYKRFLKDHQSRVRLAKALDNIEVMK